MPRCSFATWDEITGGLGTFSGGPYKVVHHTTEGPTYAGARATFKANKSDPHFSVDGNNIYQHIDTAETARALRNDPGGVQTNRDSAVQIEVVGYAGKLKDAATLQNVARLCRWIESTHGVPQEWPNGFPRHSTNGQDPGGHNRNETNWDTRGGHYGHSQVPENVHWDPGYSAAEVLVVTPAAVPAADVMVAAARGARSRGAIVTAGRRALVSVMFTGRDHAVVRIRTLGKGRAAAREIVVDAADGLSLAHELPRHDGPRRKLEVSALVNDEPARIRREGTNVLVVETRPKLRHGRKYPRRECARIVIAACSGGRPSRRGSCPASWA